MTTILLTGFEPFGGDAANPSGDAVRELAERWDAPERLVSEALPVTFAGAAGRLRVLLEQHRPDVVLATGLAGGRAAVGVERVAINLADARIPDNSGAQPVDEPCVAGAPLAHFATLPVKAIAAAIGDADIPAEVSHTAGTFVCNHVFFHALHHATQGVRAGFIHLPWATGQGAPDDPELPAEHLVRALDIAIRTTLSTSSDLHEPAGTLH